MTTPHPSPSDLLSLGEFSRRSRLSRKALRLYDTLDLLPPAWVDEASGYRYYAPGQLERARLIVRLRQLNLPLAEIRQVVDAPAAAQAEQLRGLWQREQQAFASREALAQFLMDTLSGETPMTYDIRVRRVPAQQLLTVTRHVLAPDLPQAISEGFAALHRHLTEHGAQLSGAPLVIYHGEVTEDSDGPAEICWPYRGELPAHPDFMQRPEPAYTEAYVTLTRAQFQFPEILQAYAAVQAYAEAHGERSLQPTREVYPRYGGRDWSELEPGDPAGEVTWPFVPTT
ncbi:MerR family transcriptional regulator [Deinococcus sp. Marseille-Q6407]|uniref:MerR family transcriptional regulator n=1 Tax=Deinococcus sp. Marseille-Q6407 TaxID=2969223 RepID=UPI0021C0B059|nr:helix-turn-helix domain-containing protein [Deinococcus sp. Marseille-Q6407]